MPVSEDGYYDDHDGRTAAIIGIALRPIIAVASGAALCYLSMTPDARNSAGLPLIDLRRRGQFLFGVLLWAAIIDSAGKDYSSLSFNQLSWLSAYGAVSIAKANIMSPAPKTTYCVPSSL
jgi:hypothetical protein